MKTEHLKLLLHNLEQKELELNIDPDNNVEILAHIDLIRTDLDLHFKNESEGIAIRSRAKYSLDGEKATSSFCNLEKINASQKYISRLKVKTENIEVNLDSQAQVMAEILRFYSDLYSNKDNLLDEINIENFLGDTKDNIPKLNQEQKMSMEGFITHNFSLFPIVENSLFKIDNRNITPNFFRGIKSVLVAYLLCEHNTTFKDRDQFNLRFELNINFLEFESLKRSILAGARKLNFNIHTSTIHPEPRQPLLISLLSVQKKGCRTFYDCLMSKQFLNTGTGSVENKWHTELGTLLSVHSWDHFYKMQSKIKFFNDIKWLQYRILHHSLKTNYVVSKFINDMNPDCTFCKANPETISHLFFFCPLVLNFWEVIKNTFSNFDVEINITASKILFGDLKHSADSRNNMIILFGKMFIWKQKYEKSILNIVAFKNYLMHALTTLCCIYDAVIFIST